MKKSVKIVICLCITAFMVFAFTGFGIYSQNFNEDVDIIEAIKEEPSYLKCNGVKSKATMTEDEVAQKVEDLFYGAINMNKYFIVECDSFTPYLTESNDRVLWWIGMHVSGIPDYKHIMHFSVVFDEESGRFVRFKCDSATKKDGEVYLYEELSEEKYSPDITESNEAYKKAEAYTTRFAEYLGMKVESITFDHCELERYTFKAVLSDSKGEKVEVKVSYNVSLGKYNFNY